MQKVLVFNGSPRKDGNTSKMCKYIESYLKRNSIEYTIVDSPNSIHPCKACGYCSIYDGCCIRDEWFTTLLNFREYTHFIIASPVYFFQFSSQAKAFIDRTGCYEWDGKKIALVLCSGSDGYMGGADLVEESIKRNVECYKTRRGHDVEYCGMYHKVTGDKILPLTSEDVDGLNELLGGMLDVKESE